MSRNGKTDMARDAGELKDIWLAGLQHERRLSPHTLKAYRDDVERFLVFLTEHRGGNANTRRFATP